MKEQFSEHVMVCNSTGNQTVNLLPILQFGTMTTIIVSTPLTEANESTKRLCHILKKNSVQSEVMVINEEEEKNLKDLTNRLIERTSKYHKIAWNISGGQKIPAASMLDAFQIRIDKGFKQDIVLYTEANPPSIWFFDKSYKSQKVRTSVFLSLEDFLYLAGYEALEDKDKLYPDPSYQVKQNLEIGWKALSYFRENELFREAFFNYMKPKEAPIRTREDLENAIKRILNEIRPSLNELNVSMRGYENLENQITKIFSELNKVTNRNQLTAFIKPLKLIKNPRTIYDDYWNQIKRKIIEKTFNSIEFNEVKVIFSSTNEADLRKLLRQIKDIGGISSYKSGPLYKKDIPQFSKFGGNGLLFEWMVAALIVKEVENDERMRSSISEIYHGVRTRRLKTEGHPDAEHDILIVTRFGTLIIVELKTYEFSGNLVKAQEGLAYKKSGPYGKAVIIGPLLSEMVKTNENGKKEYPPYINGAIKDQEETARQNGTEYYYLDKVPNMLKQKLYVQ